MDLMAEIACDEVLELAYGWLCRRRERMPLEHVAQIGPHVQIMSRD